MLQGCSAWRAFACVTSTLAHTACMATMGYGTVTSSITNSHSHLLLHIRTYWECLWSHSQAAHLKLRVSKPPLAVP